MQSTSRLESSSCSCSHSWPAADSLRPEITPQLKLSDSIGISSIPCGFFFFPFCTWRGIGDGNNVTPCKSLLAQLCGADATARADLVYRLPRPGYVQPDHCPNYCSQ